MHVCTRDTERARLGIHATIEYVMAPGIAGFGTQARGHGLLVEAEGGDERLLGDLDAADLLHLLLAFLLALEQLALAA